MFLNPRYITKGFQDTIPLPQQLLLFSLIDERAGKENTDYLQVFELSREVHSGIEMQRIVHRQEQPQFERSYLLKASPSVSAKVFVIDDEDHHTFLLAEEY